jgi:uncharacterized repeat protein (TIGR01451 family)
MDRTIRLVAVLFLLITQSQVLISLPPSSNPQAIQAPVLKWQKGGCYSSWCETGWYSSPAAADLDGDNQVEVVGATYSLFILNGKDGTLKKRVASPGSSARVWPGVVLADINKDGDLEIVTAHGSGYVRALNSDGSLLWLQRPANEEFRSLAVGDLNGMGELSIAVGRAYLNHFNAWALLNTGAIHPGWPQLSTSEGSAAGIYNDNIGLGDLDGDHLPELVFPSDTITIGAYQPDGSQLGTNVLYHDHPGHDMDFWAEVPAYVDLAYEVQGYGPCYTEFTPRANFADGPANVVDVNRDGVNEVVAIGNVHDCHTTPYTNLYNTPYILNADRTRFQAGGYNWSTPPLNTGAPLIEDYNVIESVAANPVTVDLDNDGKLEILYASYDGKMHAFWLDKTEHGNWPYSVYNAVEGFYRFASEPVVADLDNNSLPEVLFASWTQKGSHQTGKLYILDNQGHPLQIVSLPDAYGSPDWNGAMAAPTLANIDADADLELILNTANSGIVAYDLPGTANARIYWGTGRGNYQRTGSYLVKPLQASTMSVTPALPEAGDILTYTISLRNPGPLLPGAWLTDTLPAPLTYLDNLAASSGTFGQAGGVITWTGSVPVGASVTITFRAQLSALPATPYQVTNTMKLNDGLGIVLERQAASVVDGLAVYLPLIRTR